MAFAATRTLFAILATICAAGLGFSAEKSLRTPSVKKSSTDRGQRVSWEPPIHLDGRPVQRYSFSKPLRTHRFAKAGKDTPSPLLEDVDPEWVNLDGFAIVGGTPVNITGPVIPPISASRPEIPVQSRTRVNRTVPPSGVKLPRINRRPPQSSSGPRQPERALAGTPLLDRRRHHNTKPQSDQRNRSPPKLASESVHVVSLQAQRNPGRSTTVNRAAMTKIITPVPEEYEAKDISVRVMSPQSVLISWVDPAVEMEKIAPGGSRFYTVKYREKGESARWEYKDSTQRRMLIDSLSADGMYEFSVRISQGENHSKWSTSVFQRTPESAPSGPPENFEVAPVRGKGTAVMATWDQPEEPNGRIREYILSYAPAMKPFGMKSVTYRGSTTSATIDGLTPGDRYIFKIKATNRKGQGPQSKAFSVVMPGISRAVSTSSRKQESGRSLKDRYKEDTDQSTEVTEEPTTPSPTTQAPPTNKRTRPLSQTRSYHSIFSSLRGSIRNGLPRGRMQDKEPEAEEGTETPITLPPTTIAPQEATSTTTEAVEEKKEPDNDVIPPESEDKENEPPTPYSLKLETISPTKPASNQPKHSRRRPIKIRVHQKLGSKYSSSSSSPSPSSSLLSDSSTNSSSSSSSSSDSATSWSSLPIPSRTQESAASRKDYTVSKFPNSKKSFIQPSITLTKTSPTSTPKQTTSISKTEAPSVGRGSAAARRTGGSGPGSRYGYGQKNIGSRNPPLLLNGYNHQTTASGTPQYNLPDRTQNQATLTKTETSVSQSALPTGSQNHEPSSAVNARSTLQKSRSHASSIKKIQEALETKSQSISQSRSNNRTDSKTRNPSTFLSTSQTVSQPSSDTNKPVLSQSTEHTGTHNPETSRNTESLHTPTKQDTLYTKKVEDDANKNTEGSHSSTIIPHTQAIKVERPEKEQKEETRNAKPAISPSRFHQSIAERFPALASRYPGRFGLGTKTLSSQLDGRIPLSKTSSSIGAGQPILRGTPTRVSGAKGASGVSVVQGISEGSNKLSIRNQLKNGEGVGLVKPSLTNTNTESSGSRDSPTSSSSSFPSAESSNHNSYQSSGGHRDSSEPTQRGTSDNSKGNREVANRETYDRRETVPDPTVPSNTSPSPSVKAHKTLEDNESVHTREAIRRTRPGSPVSPTYRRPIVDVNGRARFPLQVNRQLGGSRSPRVQTAQNARLSSLSKDSSTSMSTSSSSSPILPQPALTSDQGFSSLSRTGTEASRTGGVIGRASESRSSASSQSSSARSVSRDSFRSQWTKTHSPIIRGKPTSGGIKPGYGNGKNVRPNLTSTVDKESSSSVTNSKAQRHRFITGPDGTKWVVDLEKGVLMNEEGKVLQDSQGRPKRVVIGEDGRTIFDHQGSPLVNQEGMALFGHGRDSQPVVNPKDKVLTLGGKPIVGLDLPQRRTTTTTTTKAPTTTPEPTTTEWITESTTLATFPTCPPGTFSKTDEYGYPVLDEEGILDCYPEEEPIIQTTLPATTTTASTTTPTTTSPTTTETTTTPTTTSPTTTEITTTVPESRHFNNSPLAELDLTGKKRFTASYVNYIQKDPGAPCSLTEALEYLQVDILEGLMEKESLSTNQNQPPKNKPHNFTVVAMEGCHSFVILDWARPLKDDMVSGYMVHSASYDDVLNNRWSSSASSGTNLAVENLKPNSRYYFKVQAKNVFGLGPVSDTLTYVTESDDPLLIERPPGGEPIWIPFSFKFNIAHSACKGSQFVKRTWYRKFVGVVLCNSLRYKIFMGDGLREPFYSIGDTFGQGEDHCQFVDSHMDGRTGPVYLSNALPKAQGYHRSYRQEPVIFGPIGRRTPHPFVGWYECGVPIPGKW